MNLLSHDTQTFPLIFLWISMHTNVRSLKEKKIQYVFTYLMMDFINKKTLEEVMYYPFLHYNIPRKRNSNDRCLTWLNTMFHMLHEKEKKKEIFMFVKFIFTASLYIFSFLIIIILFIFMLFYRIMKNMREYGISSLKLDCFRI